MANPRLHLDADASYRKLQRTLAERGHDVTRTPNDWMPLDASDEYQLLAATARQRVVLTFNVSDFVALARNMPEHNGIVLANQRDWTLSSLISALDHLLSQTSAEDWTGQARWLNDWRP